MAPSSQGPRKILLTYGQPQRDFLPLLLIAARLAALGHRVYLLPGARWFYREIWALAPDLVILDGMRGKGLLSSLRKAGIPYGFLDVEGGPLSHEYVIARHPLEDVDRKAVALAMFWGQATSLMAFEAGIYGKEQMATTGCPRFDFYAEPWSEIMRARLPHPVAASDRLILINGRSRAGTWTRDEYLRIVESQAAIVTLELDVERRMAEYDQSVETFRGLIETGRMLAERFPSAQVVLRPHPFEKIEWYRSALGEAPANLHIIREGTVTPWILKSAAVVQIACTTSFEAGFAGVPTLTPGWVPAFHPIAQASAVSHTCATPEEMTAAIAAILDGRYEPPTGVKAALDTIVPEWFGQTDGRAHERVCDQIAAQLTGQNLRPDIGQCRRWVYRPPGERLSSKATLSAWVKEKARLSPNFLFGRWRVEEPRLGSLVEKLFELEQARSELAGILGCAGDRLPGRDIGVARAAYPTDYVAPFEGQALVVAKNGSGA